MAWGDPPHRMGRIPQGVLVARQFQADSIVFGTGASSKEFRFDDALSGALLEAEYSLKYLEQNFDNLLHFEAFRKAMPEADVAGDDWARFREFILSRIVLDTTCQNTIEEIQAAARIFLEKGIQQSILVSSPSHVVRCLRDAISIYSQDPQLAPISHLIMASPSITCYEGTTPADVVVVEPPHRPDRHVVPTHRRIQRMLTLQKLNHDDLVHLIEEFDDLLQRYEHRYFNGNG